jgi:hypothetical protein
MNAVTSAEGLRPAGFGAAPKRDAVLGGIAERGHLDPEIRPLKPESPDDARSDRESAPNIG